MRPQNSAGSSLITFGPGVMPWMMKAPSMSAMTGCAGRPSVSSGMKEVCAAALLADSGPATPSIAPCPNVSGLLGDPLLDGVRAERGQDVAGARKDAERRAQGRAAQDRGQRCGGSPSRVGHRFLIVLTTTVRVASSSRLRRISADAEDADRDRHEVDPREQLAGTEGEARRARDRCPARPCRTGVPSTIIARALSGRPARQRDRGDQARGRRARRTPADPKPSATLGERRREQHDDEGRRRSRRRTSRARPWRAPARARPATRHLVAVDGRHRR